MKSFLRLAAAIAIVAAASFASITQAEARNDGAVIAGAIIGGMALGAILSNKHSSPHSYAYESPRTCHQGPTQCRWVQNCWYDKWGRYRCGKRKECFNPVNCY
ncbi:MAG: hypothetical protein AB7G34_11790 [Hyphomicrobiales bacterium]